MRILSLKYHRATLGFEIYRIYWPARLLPCALLIRTLQNEIGGIVFEPDSVQLDPVCSRLEAALGDHLPVTAEKLRRGGQIHKRSDRRALSVVCTVWHMAPEDADQKPALALHLAR